MNAQNEDARNTTPVEAKPGASLESSGRRRVHPSYIWLGGARALGVIVIALLAGTASSIGSLMELASLGRLAPDAGTGMIFAAVAAVAVLILIIALVIGIHAWAWRHLWYELGPEEISVYSGIFSKKRMHVPYDRVQTVDQKASLLQRAFGVCNVTIDTAGGASNKAVLIPYLRKSDADALRHEIYARKMVMTNAPSPASPQPAPPAGSPVVCAPAPSPAAQTGNVLDRGDEVWQQFGGLFAGNAFDLGAPSFEYRLTNKELVFTGLSNNGGFGVVLLTMLAAVGSVVGFAFDVLPNESNMLIESATSLFDLQMLLLICGIVLVVAAVIGWGFSILGTCVQYGGFHARRRGTRIEVERGLLKHQTESLDIGRVQSVIIKQSFIRRLIGYCELSIGKISAAESGDSSGDQTQVSSGLIVHPFVKIDRVQEILDGLVPEFSDVPSPTTRVAPVALRRGLIRRCLWQGAGFWTAACTGIFQTAMHVASGFEPEIIEAVPVIDLICAVIYGFAAVFLVFDIVGTVLWFRESAFSANKRFTRIKNGGLSSIDVAVPRQKIQFGNTKSNPFQRMARTSTIQMRTAAGVGTTTQLIDVPVDAANTWLNWLVPDNAKKSPV